jgi:2-keto-3-deoxy-galactonokinase
LARERAGAVSDEWHDRQRQGRPRGPKGTPARTKYLVDDLRRTIEHQILFGESGGTVQGAFEPNDLLDAIEAAERRSQLGNGIECAEPEGLVSLLDGLSGMLIGHEIRAAGGTGPVLVVGAAGLEERYLRALRHCGREASGVPGETATVRGLRLIHDLAGKLIQ